MTGADGLYSQHRLGDVRIHRAAADGLQTFQLSGRLHEESAVIDQDGYHGHQSQDQPVVGGHGDEERANAAQTEQQCSQKACRQPVVHQPDVFGEAV